jgi:hypothetical protein
LRRNHDRLRFMRKNPWHILIAAVLVAACSSCCEQQYNHSVRRMWCDYNSFGAPALSFEQVDHLPYPAAQVGYYRWMYDKDPGHQLAALGPVTPPACVVPQCVPAGDNPFEYQVAFPNAIPYQTDTLWGETLPEPINTPHGPPLDGPSANGPGKEPPPGMLTVPMAPVLPPAAGNKPTDPARPAPSSRPSIEAPGAPLPGFEWSPPPPRPVDEDAAPMLGPASQADPNLRLTTGSPAAQPAPATAVQPAPPAASNGIWPR